MKTYLAVLIGSALCAFFLTPWVRMLAFRWGAVDLPASRKVHMKAMPRLGGLAVYVGFVVCWVGFYVIDNRVSEVFQSYEKRLLGLAIGSCLMLVLGIYDDIKGADARKKLVVQLLAATCLIASGMRIETLTNPFGAPFELGWLSIPFTLLWVVGVTNAVNLLDGIDGLATGVAACIGLTLAVFSIWMNNVIVAVLSLCLTGACLGFLPHNYYPARIFLGDTGSLVLGFILSAVGIMSVFKAPTAAAILLPILIFALPIFDTSSVIIGRVVRGDAIFEADKSHVHHRLLDLGWSHKKASTFLYLLTGLFGFCALAMSLVGSIRFIAVVFVMVIVLVLSLIWSWRRAINGGTRDRKKEVHHD